MLTAVTLLALAATAFAQGMGAAGAENPGNPLTVKHLKCACQGSNWQTPTDGKVMDKDGNELDEMYGAYCGDWDETGDDWCYVDPCFCELVDDMVADDVFDSTERRMYKSKQACGERKDLAITKCEAAGTEAECEAAGCNWSVKQCNVPKQVDELIEELECADKVNYGANGALCRCRGDNGQARYSEDGQSWVWSTKTDFNFRHAYDYGGHCKVHDEPGQPGCQTTFPNGTAKEPAAWCTSPWCYVDPCQCGAVSDATLSDYFVDTIENRGLYYSYENCGSGTNAYIDDQCNDIEIQRVRRMEIECPDPATGEKKRVVKLMSSLGKRNVEQGSTTAAATTAAATTAASTEAAASTTAGTVAATTTVTATSEGTTVGSTTAATETSTTAAAPSEEPSEEPLPEGEKCYEEVTCADDDMMCNFECINTAVSDEMSICIFNSDTQSCQVDRSAANSNRARENCGPTRGRPGCRCLGTNFQNAQTEGEETFIKALVNGNEVNYPANYGQRCQSHAEPAFDDCAGEFPARWCRRSWCFVDPCTCDLSDLERVDYFADPDVSTGTDRVLYKSYATCAREAEYEAEREAFNAEVNMAACSGVPITDGSVGTDDMTPGLTQDASMAALAGSAAALSAAAIAL